MANKPIPTAGCWGEVGQLFALAKIQRIGHDHQAPFWHVVVGENLAVTRGKNKLPHAQYTSEPKDFLQILDPL